MWLGGKIKCTAQSGSYIAIRNNANLNIWGGEISSNYRTISNNWDGKLNIYGGTIISESTTTALAVENNGIIEMMRRRVDNECFN